MTLDLDLLSLGDARITSMAMGTAALTTGASGKFASDRAVSFMQELVDRSSKVVLERSGTSCNSVPCRRHYRYAAEESNAS